MDVLPYSTDDLTYLYCWVCSEEEDRSSNNPSEVLNRQTPRTSGTTSRFVHPCKCSLVAHEKCLLSWIRQCRRDKPDAIVACPQCKTPYQLEQPVPILLAAMDRCSKAARSLVPFGAALAAAGGVWVAATAYGCLAMRLFLGKHAARRALSGRWPWHYWVDIPMIPFVLVASRLPVLASFSTWLPTLIALPIGSAPLTSRRNMMLYRYSAQATFPRMYPPNPVMTTLLLPWLRVLYLAFKRQIYKQVFSGSASRQRSPPSEQSTHDYYGRPTTRMIVVGEDASGAHLVDGNELNDDTYETLDDGTLVPHGGWRDEAVSLDELEYRVFNEGELPTTIYVSFFSLSKLVVQSLTFPFISSLMGGLLGTASKFSSPLRRLLGIAPGINPEPGCESWMSLLWSNSPEPPLSSSAIARGAEPLWVDDLGAEYDDLDPVWYRNALGGALYILIKDGLVLLYRYLQVKQLRRRRIKNLPFSEGVARELMSTRR